MCGYKIKGYITNKDVVLRFAEERVQVKDLKPEQTFIFSDEKAKPFAELMKQVFYLGEDNLIRDAESNRKISQTVEDVSGYSVVLVEHTLPEKEEKKMELKEIEPFSYDPNTKEIRGRILMDDTYYDFYGTFELETREIKVASEDLEELISKRKFSKRFYFNIMGEIRRFVKNMSPKELEKITKEVKKKEIEETIEEPTIKQIEELFDRFVDKFEVFGEVTIARIVLQEFWKAVDELGIDREYLKKESFHIFDNLTIEIKDREIRLIRYEKPKFSQLAISSQELFKGIFAIQEHEAKKAKHHFDIRIEAPLELLDETLEQYEKKREKETPEPMTKDKEETALISFVTKKDTPLPKSSKDVFYVIETELHPTEYASFEGTIPEGSYGAGEVEIYDKGKLSLLELTDKKVKIDINSKKYKGIYTFVKIGKGKIWKVIKS